MDRKTLALAAKNVEHWSKAINKLKKNLRDAPKERLAKYADRWKKDLQLKEAQVIVWLSELEAGGVVVTDDAPDAGEMSAKG